MKILMVLTSHDILGSTGEKTGFWLEEFAAPYYVFKDAGAAITLASPQGGQPPLDPKSDDPSAQTESTKRFRKDHDGQKALASTVKLAQVNPDEFDAVFYPGGHGPLWDLAQDPDSKRLIETMHKQGKPLGFVCHAPAVLRTVQGANGEPLVKGKKVTAFSNSEEAAVGLTDVVPFLVEDMLVESGGKYAKAEDWQNFVCEDGALITGQNPASSAGVATALLKQLRG